MKPHRIQKSVGVEETYWENLIEDQQVYEQLQIISNELSERLSKKNIKGRTITLKIKYQDFSVFTRSRTQDAYFENSYEFYREALKLWQERPFDKPIRLLGLSLSKLNTEHNKIISVQLKIPFQEYDTE